MHSSRNIITSIYLFYRDIVRIDVSISNIFGKDIIFSIIYNIDSYVTQASLLFGRWTTIASSSKFFPSEERHFRRVDARYRIRGWARRRAHRADTDMSRRIYTYYLGKVQRSSRQAGN